MPIPAFKYFIEIVFLRQINWEAASKFNGSLVTNGLAISGMQLRNVLSEEKQYK